MSGSHDPLREALLLLDPIIKHVESWPPSGDSFLDDLRTIRAALASAGSVLTIAEIQAILDEAQA